MEKTEAKLKDWCKKKKYFCKKFMTHTSVGFGNRQEADFLIATDKEVIMVECKERHGNLFVFNNLTQERKMLLMTKKTSLIKPYILFNFIEHNTLIVLTFEEYQKIKNKLIEKRKSFNIKDIPDLYKFSWKTLKLPKGL